MNQGIQYLERRLTKVRGLWRAIDMHEGLTSGYQMLLFVATLIATFSRLPGALLHPQFYAEDGWVWYQQAYNLQWLQTIGITQAGFVQLMPRLVTGITLLFPMQYAPLIMNLAGAVVQVLPVNVLLSRRCTPWGPLSVRILMSAIYIAIPNALEVHIVLTNAMWHLAVLQALLAFSTPPSTWHGRLTDFVVFAVGSISGPYSILLLPPVAVYYWIRRQRWTLIVIVILSIGVIVQIFSLAHSARNAAAAPLGATPIFLLRIVAGRIFFDSVMGSSDRYIQIRLLVLIAAAGCAILVWGWRSAPLAVRLFFAFTIIVFAASMRDPLAEGTLPRWQVLQTIAGMRYWFFPSLAFLWAAAWCACGGRTRVVQCAGITVLMLAGLGAVNNWSYPAWPYGHFAADVERFNTLKPGEHMTFSVYDPGNRKMELVKH